MPVVLLCALVALGIVVAARPAAPVRPAEITVLGFRGDAFYATVRHSGSSESVFVRSDDGGRSWAIVDRATVPKTMGPGLPQGARCANDGVCYRRNQEGFVVERGDVNEAWTVEYTTSRTTAMRTLDVNPANSSQAMMQVDRSMIAFRDSFASWMTLDVAAATEGEHQRSAVPPWLLLPLTSVALAFVLSIAGGLTEAPGRFQSGWVLGNVGMLGLVLVSLPSLRANWSIGWLLGIWVVADTAVLVIRRVRRSRTLEDRRGHP